MVNASLNWASIVGIVLAIVGVAYFFSYKMKPGIERATDIVIALILILDGGILFFQGWRLDPILQFGQFIFCSVFIYSSYEVFTLRKSLVTKRAESSLGNRENDWVQELPKKINRRPLKSSSSSVKCSYCGANVEIP